MAILQRAAKRTQAVMMRNMAVTTRAKTTALHLTGGLRIHAITVEAMATEATTDVADLLSCPRRSCPAGAKLSTS